MAEFRQFAGMTFPSISFGPYSLDGASGLSRNDKPLEIGQKAHSVLRELAKFKPERIELILEGLTIAGLPE